MPETSTDNLLRLRFHELREEIEASEASIEPLRAKRDALLPAVATAQAKVDAVAGEIRQAEAPLFEKKNELARLSRALGGKTALSE